MAVKIITFGLEKKLIGELYKKLKILTGNRNKELNKVNDFLYSDPLELVKYYVEPDCQDINPADTHDLDFLTSRESLFKKIEEFRKPRNFNQVGNNQMFILSDAGMGKTSLLAMLKLLHLTSFLPKKNDFILEKLGKKTLAKIRDIKNKRKTFLLLDALDEDPMSIGRVKERLLEVLKATKSFHRVIISCRTQFFPETEKDSFERPGLIKIGGYVCRAKYLSLFDDAKVNAYLKKRFHTKSQKKEIEKAKKLIGKMGSLRCRPMLLSYIENLMESPSIQNNINIYNIYKALVDSWLTREEEKTGIPQAKLLNACEILAVGLYKKEMREIPEADLDIMIESISKLKDIKAIEIKGRSLLNRNSEGHYRFSHYSIQEFLVVRYFVENPEIKLENKLHLTDLIVQMLLENCKETNTHLKNFSLEGFDIMRINFREIDLTRAKLEGVSFKEANLQGANLQGANLFQANLEDTNLYAANLQGANLQGACLSGSNLKDVNLKGANIHRTNLQGLNLQGAILEGTDLEGSMLQLADLRDANLRGANLKEADLLKADLRGANLQGAMLQQANLERAKLQRVKLLGAKLWDANLKGANLTGAMLQQANLERAKLLGSDLREADLSGTKLERANLKEADLTGANFQGADLSGADLQGAKGLTAEMLLEVKILYQVKNLNPKLKQELKAKKPELFEKPKE